jgi:trigger factor
MSVVAQRYGYSVQYEVMNDKVGQAFSASRQRGQAARRRPPRITEKEGAPEGQMAFDATFEVYPEVKLGDLSAAEVERVSDRSDRRRDRQDLDILRKQRRTFAQRPQPKARGRRPRDDRLRRQDRRRAVRRRQGRGSSS